MLAALRTSVALYNVCRLVRVPQESLGTHTLEQPPVAEGAEDYAWEALWHFCCRFMRLGRHLVAGGLQRASPKVRCPARLPHALAPRGAEKMISRLAGPPQALHLSS